LAGLFLTILNILLHYNELRSTARAKGASPAGPILGMLIAIIFYAFFRVGIARMASNIMKWVFVIFTAVSVATVPLNFSAVSSVSIVYALLDIACFVLQVTAAYFLFRRDAVKWLKDRRSLTQREF
jgi:hypothetical protein